MIYAVASNQAALRVAVSVDCVIPVVQRAYFLVGWFLQLALQSKDDNENWMDQN